MLLKQRAVSATTLLRVGMVCLLLFALTDRLIDLRPLLGEGWADGTRGMLLGLSGGFNLLSVIKKRRSGRPS